MSDRRLTPCNGRVGAAHLRGQVEAARFVRGTARAIGEPVVDLLRAPGGRRERQLVSGQGVMLYEEADGWAFVQADADGYVGYLQSTALRAPVAATHRVSARSTHVYSSPDFKAPEVGPLSFGSLLEISATEGRFLKAAQGYVPRAHLAPLSGSSRDPVEVAELFLGTPYLWGGNSGFGIDCSGLVQAACRACGIPCPGDSDMQEAELGTRLSVGAAPVRGDLLFWKGHVGWVADKDTLLHANVHHMAVAREDLTLAIARIEGQGDGPVTSHKRLNLTRSTA